MVQGRVVRYVAPLLIAAALAACGGGGGGGGGTAGSTSTSITPVTPASLPGQLTGNGSFANAVTLFSCGCSGQAGQVKADSTGSFVLPVSSTAVPSSPSPTYTTVPGRNYIIIGTGASGLQSWTMGFLGNSPTTNVNLYGTSGSNISDQYTTAAALYIYFQSQNFTGDQTYDRWNFNTIATWTQALKQNVANNAAETQLLNDITTAQGANQSLYPVIPAFDTVAGATPNATIANDLQAVAASGDSAIPTPCPSTGCTNTPKP